MSCNCAINKKNPGCDAPCECQHRRGVIREEKALCPRVGLLSATVETIASLKLFKDALVHVTSNNTTYYVDELHRVIALWAGPVEVENYDYEKNPLGLRGQVLYDFLNNRAVYYDKTGNYRIIEEPTGEIEITANGNYEVKQYATAEVAVPEPTGTISITENGTVDVADYAEAEVNVESAGGAILDETEMATIDWSSDTTALFNDYYKEALSPTEEDLAEAAKVSVYTRRIGSTRGVSYVRYDGTTISEPTTIKYFPYIETWTLRVSLSRSWAISPAGFLATYFPDLVGFPYFRNIGGLVNVTAYFSFEGLTKLEVIGTLYFGGQSRLLSSLCKDCWRLLYVGKIQVSSTNALVLTSMFENCYSLRKVVFEETISGTQNEKATSFTNMFANCYSLAYLDLSAFNITALSSLFDDTVMTNVPTDCQIVVGTEDDKATWLTLYPDYTNVSVRGAE